MAQSTTFLNWSSHMGYQTNYTLKVTPESNKILIDRLRLECFEAECSLDESGNCSGNESRWYNHEADMRAFSEVNPGVLFTLSGKGEENNDVWTKYFFNGKMQHEKQPEWVPPPFNKKKLK